MPTGGGKSLCFQLPAIVRGGLTLVISPLIALMKDQVDSLTNLSIPATFINSSISANEQQIRTDGLIAGKYRLVYLAPERLRSAGFLRAISQVTVSLLAVDEAHCISQWGHDFRPDYARLGRFRERLGFPQTVALTATATESVRADISQVLKLADPATFVTGFARENLSLRVETPGSNSSKDARLVEFIEQIDGSGIVYAATRKNCEHIVELLSTVLKRRLEFYHAGMVHTDRQRVQENFMSGRTPIVVATNAFGMGIDKPDLRFVIHYNIPGSLEAYYQEAGRAGRDGMRSTCLLLYSFQDRFIQEFFIENSYPTRETVQTIYEYLCSQDANPVEVTLQEIKDELRVSLGTQGIANCEQLLEKAGAIERLDSQQNMAGIRINSELPTLVDLLPREAKSRRKILRELEYLVGSLRGEMVLFSPSHLAARLDVKWETVGRAIKQLGELKEIEYIPPFRGRAIHVKDRNRRFNTLEIDFAELARRKQLELSRLDRVIEFATTRSCRQLEILDYFGDPNRQVCGICDQCETGSPAIKKPASQRDKSVSVSASATSEQHENAIRYAIQVALSGVIRTKGRVGKTLIAQMLVGSGAKKVKTQGLQKLSTFGLLRPLSQVDAVELLEWLLSTGRLSQTETTRFRPIVSVSSSGQEMLSGKFPERLSLQLPARLESLFSKEFSGKTPRVAAATISPAPLAHSSKAAEISEPPLDQLTPEPVVELPASLGNHTDGFSRVDLPHPSAAQPSYFWTWRLLADGYSLEHVCQVRNLNRAAVIEHLIAAAESRLRVSPEWVLTCAEIQQLDSFQRANNGTESMDESPSNHPQFKKSMIEFLKVATRQC